MAFLSCTTFPALVCPPLSTLVSANMSVLGRCAGLCNYAVLFFPFVNMYKQPQRSTITARYMYIPIHGKKAVHRKKTTSTAILRIYVEVKTIIVLRHCECPLDYRHRSQCKTLLWTQTFKKQVFITIHHISPSTASSLQEDNDP